MEPTQTIADSFARTHSVQLLFAQPPQISKLDLLTALRRRIGRVEPLDDNANSGLTSFVYPDHTVTYSNGMALPAQTFFSILPNGLEAHRVEPALQQCWDWPQARDAVSRCRAVMLVMEMMSSGLEYKERLALVQQTVSAVLDITSCLGILWMPDQRLVDPPTYIRSKQPEISDPLFPAVNVRLFNINSASDATNKVTGETLMDTLGLAALGIPDLQCHFVGLEVSDVARMLYNAAYYLFDKGDVVADGQTLQGIRPQDHWRCQHEAALVGPERIVLDINPGRPYAAGGRS